MQEANKNNSHLREQELIRKYLADTLNLEEELLIAERYEKDENFRDTLDGLEQLSVEEYDQLLTDIDNKIDNKISSAEELSKIHTVKTMKQRSVSPYRRWAIAASVLLVIAFSSIIALNLIQGPAQKLFAEHFEYKAYPDMIVRGAGEELSTAEKLAISAYNAENYEVSTEHFKTLSKKYPDNIKYNLFLGISHMGSNNPEKAITALERTPFDKSSFCNDINWYLGLAYLKVKNRAKAKEIFTKLAVVDCYYQQAATAILSKL